jgi:hypothetical protein
VSPAAATARPALQVIDAGASPEEVAAIVAAVTATIGGGGRAPDPSADLPSGWIAASRLHARGAGMRRAEWRWSDRLGGRVRT